MKHIILSAVLGFLPATAFAGGHADFAGHGTGIYSDRKTIEATAGTHSMVTTNDVWIYDNPPEGFPAAQKAICTYFQVIATGQQQPSGGSGTCQAVDPDGDISLWNGVAQSDGTLAFSVTTGTGKWTALIGAKFLGKTRHSFGGASVYDFSPVN
ncbi:hypothetical protein pfor_25c2646 [Rhodobacteraceae bacterium SB2]|jgi:hypothetical protein|nr:hypothetical protein pfor_25c2646 [Rhodobacteraceae bacterium SB2]